MGYLLLTASFLVGAFLTVRHEEEVAAGAFAAALLLGFVGVVLVRMVLHRAARQEEHLTTSIQTLERNLAQVVEDVDRFEQEKASYDVYDLRHHIEATFADPLAAFADSRESLAHCFGLQAYAQVMSSFAAGERYLNRVWSASTDGYIDEAQTYIGKAAEQFRDALTILRGYAPSS